MSELRRLIVRHRHVIQGLLTALVGDPAIAEDLFQEAAIVMSRRRESLSDRERFVAWGRGIAVNVFRDWRKRQARRPIQFLGDDAIEKVAAAFEQQPDGLWRASLLDPQSYPLKETSGSGFFTFALAWGINHGLLDREKFRPATLRAWNAMVACVDQDGKLTHVQPVGADPKSFEPDSSDVYGVGALLLAGSEVLRL